MTGSALETTGIVVLGAAGLVVMLALFRAMPRVAFVAWALVLFFVPVWIGVTIGFFWAAITGITLIAVIAGLHRMTWRIPDLIVLIFGALCVLLFALKRTSFAGLEIALLEWILPYLWGRMVLGRVKPTFVFGAISICAAVAAALALLEFATSHNSFVELPPLGPSYAVWGPLQYRGGLLRAEGAFGHSIALGASLAMASAFLLASAARTWLKVAVLAVIVGAIVVTFSRIGLVAVVITVGLSVVVGDRLSRTARIAIIVVSSALAIVVVPFLSDVFLDAGTEAAGSAAYRGDLFEIVPHLAWFGSSTDLSVITADGSYLGAFSSSVDNALLVIGLRFGIIPTLLIIVLMLLALVSVLIPGRANPASIALVAQIPAMFSVALITQYGMFVWFVGGLAVALWYAAPRSDHPPGVAAAPRSLGTGVGPVQSSMLTGAVVP